MHRLANALSNLHSMRHQLLTLIGKQILRLHPVPQIKRFMSAGTYDLFFFARLDIRTSLGVVWVNKGRFAPSKAIPTKLMQSSGIQRVTYWRHAPMT